MTMVRKLVSVVIAVTAGACSLFDDEPKAEPGTPIAGLFGGALCPAGTPCHTWSPDSKKLYMVAELSTNPGGSLLSIDPAAHTFTRVAAIDVNALGLMITPDGNTIYSYALPTTTGGPYVISRLTLSTGASTAIANARVGGFSLSGDGNTLAFIAPGGIAAADTVVALNLTTNTRRAITVVQNLRLGPLSQDGSRLLLLGGTSTTTLETWNITSGARDPIPTGAWGQLRGTKWEGTNVRILYNPSLNSATHVDSTFGAGTRVAINPSPFPLGIIWVPNQSAMFTYSRRTICEHECNIDFFEFWYASSVGTTLLGSNYGAGSVIIAGSPDGHWLAHSTNQGSLYILAH